MQGFISARKSDVLWIIYKALVNFTDNYSEIVFVNKKDFNNLMSCMSFLILNY